MEQSWLLPVLPTLLLGLAAASFLLLLLQRRSGSSSRPIAGGRLRLPPGPRPLPVIGNLWLLAASKCRHRDLYKLAERYGPIMWLRLGTQGAVVVQSPELAAEVLKHQDTTFCSRPPPTYTVALLTNNAKDVAFAPYGSYWRLVRKVMTVELLTHKRITAFQHVRVTELGRVVEAIGRHLGRPVDLGYLLGTFNLNNIAMMGMSELVVSSYEVEDPKQQSPAASSKGGQGKLNVENDEELVHVIRAAVEMSGLQGIGDAIPWLSFLDRLILPKAKLQQTKRRLDAFYSRVIREHRLYRAANPGCPPRDFVDVLLQLTVSSSSSDSPSAGEPFTDDMIMSQLTDMIAAGTDTTAVTTEWAMAELLRQPSVLEQAVRELDEVVGRGRAVAESDIPNLPYLQAVAKEALRLHPPVPLLVPHYSTRATTVAGYHIPAQTTVLVNIWALGQDPACWQHPHQFRPQRFLDHHGRSEVDVRGHHFELLPFGSGKRMCVGLGLGLTMLQLTVATLLHSFTWSMPSDVKRPQDLDMSELQGIVTLRAVSLKAVPHSKLPLHTFNKTRDIVSS